LVLAAGPRVALAEPEASPADSVTAEALFQQGRSLLLEERIAEACPKLQESFRVEPATGTLAAFAMCHEKQGKLASAWAEFTDVESRSRREGRKDREELARASATALTPRLSTLEIEVPPDVAAISGLEIKRDGALQGQAVWNVALPIDGGAHVVEATAPGRSPFSASVTVKVEGDRARLVVAAPGLVEPTKSGPRAQMTTPRRPSDRSEREEPSAPFGALEWTGIGSAGAGVIALGAGGYFLATALGERSDAKKNCEGDLCDETGLATRKDMVLHGNVATVLGVGGGVLVALGATLYFVGRASGSDARSSSDSARLRLDAGPSGMTARIEGAF